MLRWKPCKIQSDNLTSKNDKEAHKHEYEKKKNNRVDTQSSTHLVFGRLWARVSIDQVEQLGFVGAAELVDLIAETQTDGRNETAN
jgi:hypothetical protein